MRHELLRRLHRPGEWFGGEVVHCICGAGGWGRDYNRGGPGKERSTASDTKGVRRLLWLAMRILHAGAFDVHSTVAGQQSRTEREGYSQGDRGQHLPMYR